MAKPETKKKASVQEAEFGTVAWLRNSWVQFFEENAHKHMPSAALIPAGDPTLLFTTAGMVQFKPYFAGTENPPSPRLATIQKCMRTTDLESVGKTDRHLTFFEMLGNFSFGDYFKEGAIELAWNFSLNVLKLDPERIYITVYTDDDEAERIWHETIGVPKERISRLGKEDNWWGPAGDSGACGPCSELYWDRGEEYCEGCPPEECKPGGECDRYMEYWNLVFNQFNQDTAGTLHPLPRTGIDTGAGLERIAALLKGEDSVYDTDELRQLIKHLEEITSELRQDNLEEITYEGDWKPAFRVLADHARSASFAIADGIQPDSTGRGYVIRRIIRRALMYARELGVQQPLLHELVPRISEIYGDFYPDIRKKEEQIKALILGEEQRFLRTLEQGLRKWKEYLSDHRQKHGDKQAPFSGRDAFRLYDTYGFPVEMTRELAEQEGLEIDQPEYEKCMALQQEASQSAGSWKDFTIPGEFPAEANQPTEFTGYDNQTDRGHVLALISGDTSVGTLTAGEGIIVLDRTCFYAEGGGQIGDQGRIYDNGETLFRVRDTRKVGEIYFHIGELHSGEINLGDELEMEIDSARREQLMQHHSATHLLNDALRKTLGDHILQTGSLVAPDYLRFDFSHGAKLKAAEIESVENIINQAIDKKANVVTEVLPIDEAKKRGAVATFGEKYGEEVRIVSMGADGALSLEFCGGTHVSNTGVIKQFHILKETSPGAGNRRIEAVAGDRVRDYFQGEFENLGGRLTEFNEKVVKFLEGREDIDDSAQSDLFLRDHVPDHSQVEEQLLKGAAEGVGTLTGQLYEIRTRLETAEKSLLKFQKKLAAENSKELMAGVDEALSKAESVGPVKYVRASFTDQDVGNLRKFGDALKEKQRSMVVLLGNRTEKGPLLLFMANKDAVQAGANCGNLIKAAAGVIGGGGGGRPDMAQAGGKIPEKLDEALDRAVELLKESIQT